MENNAVFCEIDNNCPSQNAHPRGAKFPAKSFTSPMKPSCAWIPLESSRTNKLIKIVFFIIVEFNWVVADKATKKSFISANPNLEFF
jgi:hypothetical protein